MKKGEVHIGLLAIILIVGLALVSYFLYSYSGGGSNVYPRDEASEKALSFSTIRKSANSAQKTPATYALYGEDELRTIWEGAFDGESIPNVDFSKYMVVAAFLGNRSTGGYGIEVTEVKETTDELFITIQETIPGPSCNVSLGDTSPVHIIKLPRSDKTVTFVSASHVTSCN